MNDNDNNPPSPEEEVPTEVKNWCFTLVMAEVIFECELGIQTRRIQFVSKADREIFPRSRLLQLQQLAASNVVAELKAGSNGAIKDVRVEAVYLLGTIDLGWMTEDEFLHNETALVSAGEMPPEDNASPDPAPAYTDNVTPLRPV